MSNPLRQVIARLDQRLIAFFERPSPRKVAEAMLWGATHIEWLFFFPFRLLTGPARFFLERRHAKNVRHHR
ncbi:MULTISPECIES: hypothetical protein [Acidithiobacillus]|uniref:Uncharacterized protein n=1 Tax=Acidithiobacillus thiooxidans ATCC 19377 TaxID=637390 RepID=A0A5P9XN84_ACITH|nr:MULTISPECIES: hypothetical protein [Acidithiobacillus]MBE7567651.1 hypothetical protein [Acidithiobacillus sp. HP-11]QFX95170.1 hypothetical protein GCD22_00692 [Acidithiobacillus thiooxidans ATCC 19377]